MKRSAIRVRRLDQLKTPDFASLHPGYARSGGSRSLEKKSYLNPSRRKTTGMDVSKVATASARRDRRITLR
ncbi:hypothetical protein LPW26_05815 [Rhodopseudomonas sp. HC1]|uniref:hypothetical protein n=1 Tax=Rhodopseudomonas infernalis TaxID=2897386 RepID=UPI001EE940E1|nr:hypothetical protein [Rhodopseudomonas infernalis]MCG6204143.1 hypothetical protein [Rhodopseudomonas infernalis]